MKFGISPKSYSLLVDALKQFPEIESAAIFGSRAMGNYKTGSDIDLVLKGRDVTADTAFSVATLLNEKLPLPYYVDVICYSQINNPDLKNHVDTWAQPLPEILSK